MTSRSQYFEKLDSLGSAQGNKSELLSRFERMDAIDWQGFIHDVVNESPQLRRILAVPPSDALLARATALLACTAPICRDLIARAYLSVVSEVAVGRITDEVLCDRILAIPTLVPLPGVGATLARIVLDSERSVRVRTRAADACLSYSSESQPLLWESIDIVKMPFLASSLAAFYATNAPDVALKIVNQSHPNDAMGQFLYPIRTAVRKLRMQDGGITKLVQAVTMAPPHVARLFAEVFSSKEFSALRELLGNPYAHTETPVSKLAESKDNPEYFAQGAQQLSAEWSLLPQAERDAAMRDARAALDPGSDTAPLDKFGTRAA